MDRQPSTSEQEPGSTRALSRRRIFRGAVGVAAIGAAAGGVLTETASPARAAVQGTTVESGAVAPAVVNLSDGATIQVDASLGNDFRVTIAGNRTMGIPADPADGQKITFQVTQGAGGPFTLSWSSGYEFSAGLPQPTLSSTAGQTDLLGFIYNADKSKWLFVAFVSGFASTTVIQPTGTYRLFDSTNGPSTPVSYSGPFLCGVVVGVTAGACWLDGYWWWVCPSGQSTAAQKFALWCLYDAGGGSLVANSTVTSGTLTAGQWNYVPLAAPLPLAMGATYVAATGFAGSFPDTNNQFGSGDPHSGGIVSGPLIAYSDSSGSKPSPFNTAQAVFSVASTDPAANMPIYGSGSSNFWMDVQVTTSPPTGTSYRLWPGYPTIPGHVNSDTAGYTLGTEFQLSKSCTLDKIWYYSAPGAAGAAGQMRDLECRLAECGCRHRQHLARLVRSGWVRLGLVQLQRCHASCRGLQGIGVLRWRYAVVPGHERLLGHRSRRRWHHRRAGHRARDVGRHDSRPVHLQLCLLGLSAELRLGRRWRELLGGCRGHAQLT